jgi:hypothetical protein
LTSRVGKTSLKLHNWGKGHTCVIDKCTTRMFVSFAPLVSSCWYSTPVKDGVLFLRGIQTLCAKVCFLVFSYNCTVTVYQRYQSKICDHFTETDTQ